jgi:SPW repeat
MRRREAVLDLYNAVLGAALLLSPWLFALTRGPARVDAWAVGAAIILLSLGGLLLFAEWETWIVLACGMWLVASPWLLGFVHTAAMRVDVAIGLLVLYLAALELWLIHYEPSQNIPRQS